MYVALKEIRLQEEEGAPFTAIREGTYSRSISKRSLIINLNKDKSCLDLNIRFRMIRFEHV